MRLEQKTMEEIYLIYVNDFLTIERMAEYYQVNIELLAHWIDIGRSINNGTEWEDFQIGINELYLNIL
jgi:hypothetical protein